MSPKLTKRLVYVLAAILATFILLYIALSWYVSSHKKELIQKATDELGKHIGGQVTIGDMNVSMFANFPSMAIRVKDILITDSAYATHGRPLLSVKNISARINPFRLLTGSIRISKLEASDGQLYLFTDTSGYTNQYLLSSKKQPASQTPSTSQQNIFSKINFRNISFVQTDETKHKRFDILIHSLDANADNNNGVYDIRLKEKIMINALAFRLDNGIYLEKQSLEGSFAIRFNTSNKELSFDSIPVAIGGQPLHLTGNFKLGKEQLFSLKVTATNITVEKGKSYLTKKTATAINLVQLSNPIDLHATIDGSLAGGDPLVVAQWATRNNTLRTPLLTFSNASFTGLYTNEVTKGLPRQDPNSKVEIYGLNGTWSGLPMSSHKISVTDLKQPTVTADISSSFPLQQLNEALQTDALSLTGGTGVLTLNYKGPIEHFTPQNASLNGAIRLRNGTLLFHGPGSTLTNCNAALRFVNSDILIDTIDCSIQGHPIYLTGAAKNTLALLGPSNGAVSLSLNLRAPLLNIDHLSSIVSRKFPPKKARSSGTTNLARTAQQIDNLLSSGNISVNFQADRLTYQRFEARNTKAAISLSNNRWDLTNASLQHGNGSVGVTASISEKVNSHYGLTANIRMRNLDAQKIWYQLENFGIPDIKSSNIRGTLSTDAQVSLSLDRAGNFNTKTLTGDANFSLKNGALIDFKPFDNLQSVLKNRDVSNVRFAEIKDHIRFGDGNINIDRMEINSTLLSLFVEGLYSLDGKRTDLSIQLPVSNLKKRDKDYRPENLGTNRGGGMSVFLRARSGEDGKIKISYDPFKRFRKTKTS